METNKIAVEGIINNTLQCRENLYGSEFPIHALPEKLREIVHATYERLNYPPGWKKR